MRAEDPIRIVIANHFYKWPRVELIEKQSSLFVFPRLVKPVVHPAEDLGHVVDEIDIGVRIKPAKQRISELEHIFVTDFIRQSFDLESFFQRLGGRSMAVSDR